MNSIHILFPVLNEERRLERGLSKTLNFARRHFPGRQNYFKAAYRMLDRGHVDHAVLFARRTAEFFADDPLLTAEAAALERYARDLRSCNNAAYSVE